MLKFLSDTDFNSRNHNPMIEWEYEDGHREWEEFDTEEERFKAINANEAYNDAHPEDVYNARRNDAIYSLELRFDYIIFDGCSDGEYSDLQVFNYLANGCGHPEGIYY